MDDGTRKQHEAFWAQSAEFWRQNDEMEARLTRPVSERMLDMARVSTGMRVLDVACGRGEPAVPAAHWVGPHGWVLGVDLVEGMLQAARERASREGLKNIEFRVGDAEALEVGEKSFDVATLRWGLMYMHAPERALEAVHRALKPGGALVIASWADLLEFPLLRSLAGSSGTIETYLSPSPMGLGFFVTRTAPAWMQPFSGVASPWKLRRRWRSPWWKPGMEEASWPGSGRWAGPS
jgi:ubiquinone/menaquinone biosynthesis C-methylase UbiE